MNATHQQVQLENVVQMLSVAIHPVDSLAHANLDLQETHSLIVMVSFTFSHAVMNLDFKTGDFFIKYNYLIKATFDFMFNFILS